MNLFFILTAFALFSMLVYMVWNIFSQRRSIKNTQQISDDKYYELRSKNDFLIASFSVFVFLASFLGISSLKSFKEELSEDLKRELEESRQSLSKLQDSVKWSLDITGSLIINEIQNKNVLKKEFYLVTWTETNVETIAGYKKKIYFKDLVTTKNQPLPEFDTAPFVLLSSLDGAGIWVIDVTNEYFEFMINSYIFEGGVAGENVILRLNAIIYN